MKIRKKTQRLIPALLVLILLCCGCGEQKTEEEDVESTVEEAVESEEEAVLPEMQAVTDAMQQTVDQNGFSIDTQVIVDLQGKMIHDTYHMDSFVQVLRNGTSGLQMTSIGTSDLDDTLEKAYYKDGIYHLDDGETVEQSEKTEEEVMSMVSEVTDMVLNASETVQEVETEESGENLRYRYPISTFQATRYLKLVISRLNIDELQNASFDLEDVQLETTVTPEGIVRTQTVHLTGKIKEAIFSVPVEVDLTADFASLSESSLDFSEFDF